MSTITFDTYKFIKKLKDAGVSEAQAEAEADALSAALQESMQNQLATKSDIYRMEKELLLMKWMLGTVLAGILALILKAFLNN
ncbi:DUF1640 domain-containing protein [Thiosulfativibrio zosterae]|uniref:DUF1640 domain-containing protein n=1 Tax=Thiosulfativibrio zosterae TaxID=2675053 RepID=A0A6F8PL92_9GAMM|nr:DUF1640 domain-containing protein [Thiosulfativibrio zosterae]BBP42817.1 hypothetical protein THMIRHAT_05630 [Thiosulfativibrio zosterae]